MLPDNTGCLQKINLQSGMFRPTDKCHPEAECNSHFGVPVQNLLQNFVLTIFPGIILIAQVEWSLGFLAYIAGYQKPLMLCSYLRTGVAIASHYLLWSFLFWQLNKISTEANFNVKVGFEIFWVITVYVTVYTGRKSNLVYYFGTI